MSDAALPARPAARPAARRAPGVALRLALALAVLAAVWLPHYAHFYIARGAVAETVVSAAQTAPADALLDEIAAMNFAIDMGVADAQLIATADAVLAGKVSLPALLPGPLELSGYPHDMHAGPTSTELKFASLGLEELLLKAYDRTRDERYKKRALERVLNFSAYEQSRHEAADFLWNDHAVAARIGVLAHLWRAVRGDATVSADDRRALLSLVDRCGRLIAKPSQFNVRTNHGVMQNLALMQIGAAFPSLPEAAAWTRLGLERLKLQAAFYVSPEGFVLEHSSDYHAFGAELLAYAVRLCALNGIAPPDWLSRDAASTAAMLQTLIRPDGSLPVLGNTSAGIRYAIPQVAADGAAPVAEIAPPAASAPHRSALLPVAGYALWWSGADAALAQTVVTWSKHDGHGHKHADEGAVLFWADGIDWISNTGYWPYGADGMADAYGWRGSNAPHGHNESFEAKRDNTLRGLIDSAGLHAVDVERQSAGGGAYRREVIQLDAATLLVLDFAKASKGGSETIWTVSPTLAVSPQEEPGLYLASAPDQPRRMAISLAPAATAQTTLLRGSTIPFAGWVVQHNVPSASYALRLATTAPDSAAAALFSLQDAEHPLPRVSLAADARAEEWTATITVGELHQVVSRQGQQLLVIDTRDARSDFVWQAGPEVGAAQDTLRTAFSSAMQSFPPWRELSEFRGKLGYLIAAAALAIEAGWLLLAHRLSVHGRRVGAAIIVAFWLAFTLWALGIYLR
jgi:hypothetical protein